MNVRRVLTVAAYVALGITLLVGFLVYQPVVNRSAGIEPPLAVSPERLRTHVKRLSTEFVPRDSQSPKGLALTADYIETQLRQMGYVPERQRFSTKDGEHANIVVQIPGRSGLLNTFVIGAHHDAYDQLPGADDNASGVAGLLEFARLLRDSNVTFHHPTQLVFYTLEEPPYFRTAQMGSAVHAQSLKSQGVKVSLMISLEMIGYFSDTPGSQSYPSEVLRLAYPDVGNFIAVIGRFNDIESTRLIKSAMQGATSLPVYSLNAPTWIPGIDFSDQLNYWNEGFTGLMVTDTSFFRNKAYHTDEDTYDRLDYVRMAKVVSAVFAGVQAADKTLQ